MTSLPQSVLDMVEYSPLEDLLLAILRDRIPDINFTATVDLSPTLPMVLLRRNAESFTWRGHIRFLDSGLVDIHVFTQGAEADKDAALLSEAVRVALRDAWLDQDVIEGIGSMANVELYSSPHYTPDWATGVGPVQYADLPNDYVRYESTYLIAMRPSLG